MSTKLLLSWDTVSAHNCFSCANIVCMGDSTLVYRLPFATLENGIIIMVLAFCPPQNFAYLLFSVSLGTILSPKRTKNNDYAFFFWGGGEKKIIVVFSKVAN